MSAAARSAIAGLIAANWTHTPIIGANSDGKVPVDDSAFLTVTFPVADGEMLTIGAPGSNFWRETGGARVVLSIPAGKGTNEVDAPWEDRLDALRAALRGKNTNGVITWEPSPVTYDNRSDDGAYFELTFAVEFQLDVIG